LLRSGMKKRTSLLTLKKQRWILQKEGNSMKTTN
jgi:hypothetical protein